LGIDGDSKKINKINHGKDEIYTVAQKNGINYDVTENHILTLKFTNVEGIFWNKRGFKQCVEFKEKDITLDAYILGMWLGDGTTAEPAITNIDEEIIEYIYKFADDNDLRVSIRNQKKTECKTYYIAGNPINIFRDSLNKYKLIGNKHIPNEYLYNTREIRLKVLAGLMDSDGYMHHNTYEIIQKSNKLSTDIQELSKSLGFKTSYRKVNKACVKPNGDRVTGEYNKIIISGEHLTDVPVILARKKATKCMKKVNFLITTITVASTKNDKFVSFKVEDNSSFFGVDYTVL